MVGVVVRGAVGKEKELMQTPLVLTVDPCI